MADKNLEQTGGERQKEKEILAIYPSRERVSERETERFTPREVRKEGRENRNKNRVKTTKVKG